MARHSFFLPVHSDLSTVHSHSFGSSEWAPVPILNSNATATHPSAGHACLYVEANKGRANGLLRRASMDAGNLGMPWFVTQAQRCLEPSRGPRRQNTTQYNVYNVVCNLLYCTVLFCIVLYCIVLYCTVLYCTGIVWYGRVLCGIVYA